MCDEERWLVNVPLIYLHLWRSGFPKQFRAQLRTLTIVDGELLQLLNGEEIPVCNT